MSKHAITLIVNGDEYNLSVPANRTLLEALREDVGLTDAKYGCGTGECGACTVLVGGTRAINACLTLAVAMDGKEITTATGLARDGVLHPVQQAFADKAAVQCGYCTPGMVLKTISLLAQNADPTEEEIRKGLEGNICRCTGYAKIVDAVQQAAQMVNAETLAHRAAGGKA